MADEELTRLRAEIDRLTRAVEEARAGNVELQRHRDAWRRYAYGRGERPQDFLDGNMVAEDRGPTAVDTLAEVEGMYRKVVSAALAYIGDHHFPDLTWKVRCEEAVTDLRRVEAERDRYRDEAEAPIAMLLFCPTCGVQHVDAPEPERDWANPPHKSHLCHGCGNIWRPCDRPTNGVAVIETRGSADTWNGGLPAHEALTLAADLGRMRAAITLAGEADPSTETQRCWCGRHVAIDGNHTPGCVAINAALLTPAPHPLADAVRRVVEAMEAASAGLRTWSVASDVPEHQLLATTLHRELANALAALAGERETTP